jgi:hypothetical protein
MAVPSEFMTNFLIFLEQTNIERKIHKFIQETHRKLKFFFGGSLNDPLYILKLHTSITLSSQVIGLFCLAEEFMV